MSQWITAADVRTAANMTGTTGRYSDAVLGSNILTAQSLLQGATHRLFDPGSGTKRFTTEGRASMAIPDVRSVTSVTLSSATLDADSTYHLIPDARHSGVHTAIQFRTFGRRGGPWYLSNPEWFDRNLDHWRANEYTSLPNDLVITSDQWGWDPIPYDVLHGVKVLAAWLTKRFDGLLAGAVQTPEGSILDYTQWPVEAQEVRRLYLGGEQMAAVA